MKTLLSCIENEISQEIEQQLLRSGLYFRIFSRVKTHSSLSAKIKNKGELYLRETKKMQDISGVRVVLYFFNDLDIVHNYLCSLPNFLDKSVDPYNDTTFQPTRRNLIFRMSESQSAYMKAALRSSDLLQHEKDLIDNTYEVQLRTVLSEGWHEVEHDLRYKFKDDAWWSYCSDDSRMLNGIYATLETSERAMLHMFASITYKNYKNHDWAAMIRNHFCIHLKTNTLDPSLIALFNRNLNLPKQIIRIDRANLIAKILAINTPLPLTMSNLLFLINRWFLQDESIKRLETDAQAAILDTITYK